jgi:hypothetical protein
MASMLEVLDVLGLEMMEEETMALHCIVPGGKVVVTMSQDHWFRAHLLLMAMMAHNAGAEAYAMDDGATWVRLEPLGDLNVPDDDPWRGKHARLILDEAGGR